jgi:hypothetical protein
MEVRGELTMSERRPCAGTCYDDALTAAEEAARKHAAGYLRGRLLAVVPCVHCGGFRLEDRGDHLLEVGSRRVFGRIWRRSE